MGDGYTEIFFLDEATALAAGHRPCFECRRDAARAFAAAWGRAQGTRAAARRRDGPRAPSLSGSAAPRQVAFAESCREAAIFATSGALLPAHRRPVRWPGASAATRRRRAFDGSEPVRALTPPSTRAALAAGYRAGLHPSADGRARRAVNAADTSRIARLMKTIERKHGCSGRVLTTLKPVPATHDVREPTPLGGPV